MPTVLESRLQLQDYQPGTDEFLGDVLRGLSRVPKTLPCKYFYDARGSELFDRICELDEYYPTRTELGIMRRHAPEMARLLGPHCVMVEYGSGSSIKTRILLDNLQQVAAYVPIDISRDHLLASAAALSAAYPQVPVLPVCADYTQDFDWPEVGGPIGRHAVYFPGSTIGNFEPQQAREFLSRIAISCGRGGALLIGVDLKKDVAVLEAAYNDASGVTAAFNLNLLHRINVELQGNFWLDNFGHRAIYRAAPGRIEMHLMSLVPQTVQVGTHQFQFAAGEPIITEHSYKYSLPQFQALAAAAGLQLHRVWTDEQHLFSVQYFVVP